MDDIKVAHEEAACRRFLSIYNSIQNQTIGFVRLGVPKLREPDCICSNSVALELVGVYDNKYQAEKMWSIPRNKNISRQPDYKLLSLNNLQDEIGIKLSKLNKGNYDGFCGKVMLVCNLHSPLLQDYEVGNYTRTYTAFRKDGHFERYFDKIWATWKSEVDGNWKIRKLE